MRFNSEVNTLEEIFNNYLPEPNTGCWLWLGSLNGYGYGTVKYHNVPLLAHRVFYKEYTKHNIEGLVLHHLCKEKMCVNYDHLQPLTITEHNFLHKRESRKPYKLTVEVLDIISDLYPSLTVSQIGAIVKLSPTTVSKGLKLLEYDRINLTKGGGGNNRYIKRVL